MIMKTPVKIEAAIDPDNETVSILLLDIPLDRLENVLLDIAMPLWRQNMIDGINGARAGKELGIPSTERLFNVRSDD
jgi:hypothetical protein